MAQITTTTRTDPVRYPGNRRIDRSFATGHLWFAMLNTAGTSILFFRSTNNGGAWTQVATFTPGPTILELSSLRVDQLNRVYIAYRTSESSSDRIYLKAGLTTTSGLSFHSTLLLGSAANGGVAGAIYTGLDVLPVRASDGRSTVAVGAGVTSGALHGLELFGATISAGGTMVLNSGVIANRRRWLITGSGRITPSMGFEQNPAHLWATFGRTAAYAVKAPWDGSGWRGPNLPTRLSGTSGSFVALDSMSGVWCRPGWASAIPNPADNTTVLLYERNAANTKTASYVSLAHPTGAVRSCAVAFNAVTRDVRVYAMGTSTDVLYHCDFIRATTSWSGWTATAATAVLGANNYGVRRESSWSARYDVVTAHAGSPNTVVHTSQILAYAPFLPAWLFGTTANSAAANGAAMSVADPLDLVWQFDDPDPADTQTAWALSRQIGTGALAYYRASDNTWQAAEVKNTGTTPSRTLAAGWGADVDANHTYRVKVWDTSDTASVYSSVLVVVPSTRVDPTITVPATDGTVWTTDTITVEWSAAEQTAYRLQLEIFGGLLHDSGWRAGDDTEYTIPVVVGDGFSYTIRLYTRNNEGLSSAQISRNFTVDYIDPATPTLTATPMPTLGLTRVVITNPPPPAALNANPYFETNTSSWSTLGGTVARSTAQFHEGAASMLFTPDGVTANVDARSENVPVTVGQQYRATAWVRNAVARNVAININWRNSGGGFAALSSSEVALAANTWTPLEVTATAPALAASALLTVSMGSTPLVSHTLHIDEAELRPGDGTPAVLSNDLMRRDAGVGLDTSTDVVIARGVPVGGTFDDWTARSGKAYEYRALARGANGTTGYGAWTA